MVSKLDCFAINYFGDREKAWGIHDEVKKLYPSVQEEIFKLIRCGYLIDDGNIWLLTERGRDARKHWRAYEKEREKSMHLEETAESQSSDYLGMYNTRAKYETESFIQHGVSEGVDVSRWKERETDVLPESVRRYVETSFKIDFGDIDNSEKFKQRLRDYYVQQQIEGHDFPISNSFEQDIGERLCCPSLSKQISEKCTFQNPPLLQIYINTKIRVLRQKLSNELLHKPPYTWDGIYLLGMYDCTDPFHAALAEYSNMKLENIDGFPKTFQTFWKHKSHNSEKYIAWKTQSDK